MSFILDALKKAESERSRASGPVLVDVRIAPPRRRLPAWAWVLGAVMLANLGALGWLMLRKPAAREMVAAGAAAGAVTAPVSTAGTSTPVSTVSQSGTAGPIHPVPVFPAPVAPAGIPAAPAAIAPASAALSLNGAPADLDRLPTQRDLQASGIALPPLVLNLHVYDPTPAQRYVLLNSLQLTEGEFTPDGIKVVAITERGVVLEARGQRFLLPAGG
jgi:general secretion pathway protein B